MLGTSVSAGSSVSSQESLTCPEAPRQGESIIVDLSAIAKAPPCREDSGQELLCLGKDLIVFICLFVCALVDPVCLCVCCRVQSMLEDSRKSVLFVHHVDPRDQTRIVSCLLTHPDAFKKSNSCHVTYCMFHALVTH